MRLPHRGVFDYRLLTRDGQRDTLKLAFDSCAFNWAKLRPGLEELNDGGRILVRPGGQSLGKYLPDSCVIRVLFLGRPWSSPRKNAASFIHEMTHALDLLVLTAEQRVEIYKALHEGLPPSGVGTVVHPTWGWKVHDPSGPISDHGHDWFDGTYHEGVGEAFAEAFVAAFSTLPVGEFPAHPYTPEALARIREILS